MYDKGSHQHGYDNGDSCPTGLKSEKNQYRTKKFCKDRQEKGSGWSNADRISKFNRAFCKKAPEFWDSMCKYQAGPRYAKQEQAKV